MFHSFTLQSSIPRTPVWIHTHLHVHSHLRSSKPYVLLITSAYTTDLAQYTRDILTNTQHPSKTTNHMTNPSHACILNALSSPSHIADLANISPQYSPPLAFLRNPYRTPLNDRRSPTTNCSLPKLNPQQQPSLRWRWRPPWQNSCSRTIFPPPITHMTPSHPYHQLPSLRLPY
jgi:hypothetical protein